MRLPDHWNYLRNDLRAWLMETEQSPGLTPSQCCLLVGLPGIGKTTFLHHVADTLEYSVQWITPDKCASSKDLLDQLQKYLYPSVGTLLDQCDPTRVFIGIDDWDILAGQDRTMFLTLQQFLQSKRANPHQRRVICIGDRAAEKKFKEIHPPVKTLTLKPMSEADQCRILKDRFPTLSLGVLTHLTEHCNQNLNRAMEMAQFELSASTSASASASACAAYDGNNRLRVLELPETIPSLACLYTPKSPQDWFKLFAQDPWMVPLRFHENLPKELENRTGSKLILYDRLHASLLTWDRFMAHWINDEDSPWMDLPIQVLTLAVVLYLEPQRRLKKLKHSNASMTDFTKLLSQLSLQKKGLQTVFHQYRGSQYPIYDYPYHWIHEA